MKEIVELAEIKKIELDILIYIDEICRKNHLKYYIGYGTLIGAIRHKGFIPWDDDIDIIMPRPDYIKIMKIMQKENGRYKFISIENSKNDYNYPFAKVIDSNTKMVEEWRPNKEELGIYVDVFPLDGLGNSISEAQNSAKKYLKNRDRILYLETVRKDGIKGRFLNLIGRKNINRYILMIAKRYNAYKTQYVGSMMAWDEREVVERKVYGKGVEVEFENHKFFAPDNYDFILKKWYGDYMMLPSEKDRKPHHPFKAWWK